MNADAPKPSRRVAWYASAAAFSVALWGGASSASFGVAMLVSDVWPQHGWWLSGTNTVWRPAVGDGIIWFASAVVTAFAVYLGVRFGAPKGIWIVVAATQGMLLALAAIIELILPLPGSAALAVSAFAWGPLFRTVLIVAAAALGASLARRGDVESPGVAAAC